jgi:uncharacterized protein (TIGR02266 family)
MWMQRYHRRFDVSIQVDVASQAMFVAHRVTNISRGGLFIEGQSLPIDSELMLHLHLDGAAVPIQARARVVWNYDMRKGSSHLVHGSGLKFVEIATDDLIRLHAYLGMLAAAAAPTPPPQTPPLSH